jgi:hypothetical protein
LGRDKPAIGSRARRWQFSFPDELEEVQHEAVRAAAGFLRRRADVLPEGMVPADPTQLAVLAVHLHDQFLSHDGETGRTVVVDPDPQAVAAVLASRLRPPAATAPPRR